MFKSILALFFLFLFPGLPVNTWAKNWEIHDTDTKDIKVFLSKKDEYSEYRAEIVLDFPVQSVLGFVRGSENADWIDKTDSFDSRSLNFYESCNCHEFDSFGFKRKILYYAMQEKGLCGSEINITFSNKENSKCTDRISSIPENCREVDDRYKVNEFYGYYKLIPLEKNRTKVVMYNYIDPKFGDDIFGKIKKYQFLKGAPGSISQTLFNLKQSLNTSEKYNNVSFRCDDKGFLVDITVN